MQQAPKDSPHPCLAHDHRVQCDLSSHRPLKGPCTNLWYPLAITFHSTMIPQYPGQGPVCGLALPSTRTSALVFWATRHRPIPPGQRLRSDNLVMFANVLIWSNQAIDICQLEQHNHPKRIHQLERASNQVRHNGPLQQLQS